ncbi:MAG: hypothetical protein WCI73_03155 [Phycisphaerae bacterium]
MASRDVVTLARDYGVLHKPERATFFHVAIRKGMKVLCDSAPEFLTLVEEPEGQALDYVMVNMDPVPFCLRWGISNGIYIRRNRTDRTEGIQEQGVFPFYMEDSGGQLTATIAYSLADDYTEAGIQKWWMNRLVLGRERKGGFDFIEEIAIFGKPENRNVVETQSDPRLIAWKEETERLREIVKETKRRLA